MKAIGVTHFGKTDQLKNLTLPKPTLTKKNDVLVKIMAFSTNPIDCKMAAGYGAKEGTPAPNGARVVGWDASGVIEQLGNDVKGFSVGDEVYFAGDLSRDGVNAEWALVDHRLIAKKPTTLDHLTASSMPLATITAWESFEDQLDIRIPTSNTEVEMQQSKSILITAGAGGVGSIAIQLAKKVFRFGHVIAAAGRDDSKKWAKLQGADLVLNRNMPWKDQLTAAGIHGVDYFFICSEMSNDLVNIVDTANPFAHVCSIVRGNFDISSFFSKAMSFVWEFMGAKPITGVRPEYHSHILTSVGKLVDSGIIKPWIGKTYDSASLSNLKEAHELQNSGKCIGKIAFVAKFD